MESWPGPRNLSGSSSTTSTAAANVSISPSASYQLSSYIEYACVAVATDDHDAVYPSWAVCDKRFGAVAEYDEGLGSVDGDA
jgi:hypothetical protein